MNIFKNLLKFKKQSEIDNEVNHGLVDQYGEIARLVKEARIQRNITIQELSGISKIPEQTIISIENNNKNIRPKYPFIRSILIKLEECLGLKKNTLEKLAIREGETSKKEKNDFIVNKFDLINTWQGSLLYFFILILTLFVLKRYFEDSFIHPYLRSFCIEIKIRVTRFASYHSYLWAYCVIFLTQNILDSNAYNNTKIKRRL